MEKYCFNSKVHDDTFHEVHKMTCYTLPFRINQRDLGYHGNCHDAIAKARRENPGHSFDGCAHCNPSCHTG